MKDLLIKVAEAILTAEKGSGRWYKWSAFPEFEETKDPLLGLVKGDIVYCFDEDDDEIQSTEVLWVSNGIGYYGGETRAYGPQLYPIEAGYYSKDRLEAIRLSKDTIRTSLNWAIERCAGVARMEGYLKEMEDGYEHRPEDVRSH